ncbi:MAG TPA: flagellar basal body P-ring formation chaperone FlgA [Bryobacteraceae bacterium]|nr:flagellar basal body P-ring formation chaperone FlgA [Bryobacteraceae bacterium]
MMAILAAAAACIVVDGDQVRARDLAGVIPAFRVVPGDFSLGYAPAPGAQRGLHGAELTRVLRHYQPGGAELGDVCVARAMEPLTPERLLAALAAAVANPRARIDLVDWSRYPVPRGEIHFLPSALPLPRGSDAPVVWRGYVNYGTSRRFAVWARVRVALDVPRVTAREALPAGKPIAPAQLAVSTVEIFPFQPRPAATIAQVAGRAARRSIPAGTTIFENLLEPGEDVHPGDPVTVEVRSGRARIALECRAESAGRRGDLIPVRNVSSGKTFRARVEGPGKAILALRTPGGDQ